MHHALALRKDKFMEAYQRLKGRNAGHCRMSEVKNDYSNLETGQHVVYIGHWKWALGFSFVCSQVFTR